MRGELSVWAFVHNIRTEIPCVVDGNGRQKRKVGNLKALGEFKVC